MTTKTYAWAEIAAYLKSKGISQKFVCDKTGISRTHLHFILSGDRPLTEENKKLINQALETNF